jgi:hypothetical protein
MALVRCDLWFSLDTMAVCPPTAEPQIYTRVYHIYVVLHCRQ